MSAAAGSGEEAALVAAGLVCPRCRAPLAAGTRGELATLSCTGQHGALAFPLLDGAVPVLLEPPLPTLGRAALDLREMLRANEQWIQRLDGKLRGALAGSPTAERLSRLRRGEAVNRALLEQVFALVKRGLGADDVLEAATLPASASAYSRDFNYILAYLRRDHGGRAESEAEIAVFEAELRAELDRHGCERGSALVLGAGLGRIAWGLRSIFPRVLALDSSIVMAALFRLLGRGPLRFCELNLNNARTRADQCVDVEATLPPAPSSGSLSASPSARRLPFAARTDPRQSVAGSRLDYAVGDAAQLPVADGSQAAVVSVYFTDVLPLSRLAPEVARALRPGGVFVHFGPVSYHFQDLDEQVSAEELADRFAGYGFEVTKPRIVANTLLKSSALLDGTLYDLACFSAVRQTR